MQCIENCSCILCLELNDMDENVSSEKNLPSENFILAESPGLVKKYADIFDNKNFTYFGMDIANLNKSVENNVDLKSEPLIEPQEKNEDNKHKSVIYINDSNKISSDDGIGASGNTNILMSEVLDEYMSLDTTDNSNIINVIFKNTYPYATQLITDINTSDIYDSLDEFPLGIEADIFNRNYRKRQR